MPKVTINAPKTPVTKGSMGIAAATVPNVCKMPGPPAPFVPTPLPNIGKSGDSPQDYSTTVKIEGQPVAIRGSSFGSMGDVASQGTGGGIVSNTTQGRTKFIGPGSLNVKIEGKNVQLLGDPMLNNCGPGGSPANAATMMGLIQAPGGLVTAVEGEDPCPICEKQHQDFKETEETKADAGALATNFAKEVAAVAGRVQTMLGVVRCKCGKNYANQSAVTTVELCKAAKAAGMKHPSGIEMSLKAPRDEVEMAYVKGLDDMKRRIGDRLGNSEVFEKAWEKGEARYKDSAENRSGPASYPPGTCAAQKTLMLLLDDGALPAAMTERWHSSVGKPTQASIRYIDNRERKRVEKIEKFDHGATVPPCGTCELIVPLLLCPGERKECSHKS